MRMEDDVKFVYKVSSEKDMKELLTMWEKWDETSKVKLLALFS